MYCTKCGSELSESAAFCTACGTPVAGARPSGQPSAPRSARAQASQPHHVSSNRPNPASAPQAAPSAQSVAAPEAVAEVVQAQPRAKKRRGRAIAAAIVGVLVAVGVGIGAYQMLFAPYQIDEATFPDAALRSYVSKNVDTNYDGKVSRDEARALEALNLAKSRVASLAGIEKFPNVTAVDVSGCANLTQADLSGLGNLAQLNVAGSGVSQLDLAGNTKLEQLDAAGSALEQLDVSANGSLHRLNVSETPLQKLDATACEELEELDAHNANLQDVALGGKQTLKRADLSGTKVSGVDASCCEVLEELNLDNSECAELNIEGCTSLTNVAVGPEVNLVGMDSTGLREQWLMTGQHASLNSAGLYEGFPNGIGSDPRAPMVDIAYEHDGLNRLVSCTKTLTPTSDLGSGVDEPETTIVRYEYDGESRRPSRASYEGRSNKTSETYLYDESGNVVSRTAEGSNSNDFTSYEYNEAGQCVSFTTGYGGSVKLAYDDAGHVVNANREQQYGSGVMFAGVYDEQGRIAKACTPYGGNQAIEFVYDEAGHIVEMRKGSLKDGDLNNAIEVNTVEAIEYDGDKPVSSAATLLSGSGASHSAMVTYDEHGNVARIDYHTETGGGNSRTLDNHIEFSYKRVLTPADAPDVDQPVLFGDPLGHLMEVLPWEAWDPMAGQDPIARRFCDAMILSRY